MISARGWLGISAAASLSAAPLTARGGFDVQPLGAGAASRAKAMALHFEASRAERASEREVALSAFEELLAIDPYRVDAARRAANLAAVLGDRDRGWAILETALEANPGNVEAHLAAARFLDRFQPEGREKEMADRALVYARAAEQLFPDDARICTLLVDLLLQRADVSGAGTTVERFRTRGAAAEAAAPFWLEVAVAAGRCLDRDPEGGAIGRREVDALYQRALVASGNDPAVADAVANYHIGARQYDRAMEVLEPVMAANPELSLGREKLAHIYRIRGRREEALDEMRALTAAFPNEARTQRFLAELLAEAGEHREALRHRQRAVELGGAEPEDYIEMAACLADHFQPPRYEESLRWLDRGLATTPGEPRLYFMRGIVLGNVGRHAEAVANYRQAEVIARLKMPEMLDTRFFYKMAAAADRSGDHGSAAEGYRRAVSLVPVATPELAAGPLNDHGYMLLTTGGDVGEAGRLIRRAVELDPDNPVYLDSLGWFYFMSGQPRKALVELRRAKQLLGDEVDPEVEAHLEEVLRALEN